MCYPCLDVGLHGTVVNQSYHSSNVGPRQVISKPKVFLSCISKRHLALHDI